MVNLEDIGKNVILGRPDKDSPLYPDMVGQPGVKELTEQALSENMAAEDVLNNGLVPGIQTVGQRMAANEMFIPEVLQSTIAFKAGSTLLKPLLASEGTLAKGTAVIGTVKGDLHDIGKSLVGMMLEGAGFEVVDLGVDVSPEQFVAAVEENDANIVGMSALLTTTMFGMGDTVKALESAEIRQAVKVVVGGAPINQQFSDDTGADGYAQDAGEAVDLVKRLVGVD